MFELNVEIITQDFDSWMVKKNKKKYEKQAFKPCLETGVNIILAIQLCS